MKIRTDKALQVKPGTIIAGTLRLQDLLPAFCRALVAYGSPSGADIYARIPRDPDAPTFFVGDTDPWWSSWNAVELTTAARIALEELAPRGLYFGTHKDNDSNFGFWLETE